MGGSKEQYLSWPIWRSKHFQMVPMHVLLLGFVRCFLLYGTNS